MKGHKNNASGVKSCEHFCFGSLMRLGRCVAQMTALEVNKFKYMLELIAMDILEREVDRLFPSQKSID